MVLLNDLATLKTTDAGASKVGIHGHRAGNGCRVFDCRDWWDRCISPFSFEKAIDTLAQQGLPVFSLRSACMPS